LDECSSNEDSQEVENVRKEIQQLENEKKQQSQRLAVLEQKVQDLEKQLVESRKTTGAVTSSWFDIHAEPLPTGTVLAQIDLISTLVNDVLSEFEEFENDGWTQYPNACDGLVERFVLSLFIEYRNERHFRFDRTGVLQVQRASCLCIWHVRRFAHQTRA
jgi:hypothetical protein